MIKKASREGFTLVELSLAMVFISLLSLAIVLIIINTISSYRRGITLSAVNSGGSQLVDDFRVAIQNSSASSIDTICASHYQNNRTGSSGDQAETRCKNNGAEYFFSITYRNGSVRLSGASSDQTDIPLFGAFCTGTYSYIWNSGYFFSDGVTVSVNGDVVNDDYTIGNGSAKRKWFMGSNPAGSARVWYRDSADHLVDVAGFRLLKIKDESRQICVSKATHGNASNYDPYSGDKINVFDITFERGQAVLEEPVDLLASGDTNDLALYSLDINIPAESVSGANLFYAGSFILGTTTGGPDVKSSNDVCAVPSDAVDSNFDYCAINKFNFAAQAVGG